MTSSTSDRGPAGNPPAGFGRFTPEKIVRLAKRLGIASDGPVAHEEAPGDPEVEPGAERS